MPTTERKLRVFLCHSSHDKPAVRELYQKLQAEGWIDPWLDEEKLLPGQAWDLEIEKAVETADVLIVCLSSNSVSKEGYIQRELRFVLDIALEKPEGTIFVIPLRLENCEVPRRLRAWQYVDYFPIEKTHIVYSRLLESFNIRHNGANTKSGNYETHLGHANEKSRPVNATPESKRDTGFEKERLSSPDIDLLIEVDQKILYELMKIQSSKVLTNNSPLVRELSKNVSAWKWLSVVIPLLTAFPCGSVFIFSIDYGEYSFLFFVVYAGFLLSLYLGVAMISRRLIDRELNQRIKLQQEKIKRLSR